MMGHQLDPIRFCIVFFFIQQSSMMALMASCGRRALFSLMRVEFSSRKA